jgi:protein SCO1/2
MERWAAAPLLVCCFLVARCDGIARHRDAATSALPGLVPRLGATLPLDLRLRDAAERDVTVGRLVGGHPSIVVPVYFTCHSLCPVVLRELGARLAERRRLSPAAAPVDLAVVSLDPRESARDARAARADLSEALSGGGGRLHFLTGTAPALARLTAALGLRLDGRDGDGRPGHPSTIVVVAADGRISGYLPGLGATAAQIDDALARAAQGGLVARLDRIALACARWSSHAGPAARAAMTSARLLALAALGAVAILVARLTRSSSRPVASPEALRRE